jgi:apolipoprotein N-acyltransferase
MVSRPDRPPRTLLVGLALGAISGAFLFLATATWDIWPLGWIFLSPLFAALDRASPRRALLFGWTAGLVANLGGFYWIPHLLVRFGHLSRPLSLGLFVLLALYQGVHFGIFAYLLRKCQLGLPRLPLVLAAPALFVTMELITPFIFDWYAAISQAWVLPVIQVADLAGPLGVSFLLALSSATAYELGQWLWTRGRAVDSQANPFPRGAVITALVVIGASQLYGWIRIAQIRDERAHAPKAKVGIVQANIGITEKGSPKLRVEHHRVHLRESWKLQKKGAELLVWSESSYPFWLERNQTRDFGRGDPRRLMQRLDVPLFFGAGSYSRTEPTPTIAPIMMAPDGRILGGSTRTSSWCLASTSRSTSRSRASASGFPSAGHFARGTEVVTFPFRGHRIGPMICYEDIIPAFGRRLARLEPNLLVNITNDAWFGATAEPYEHMALAVYRSVELRLDMVRAVNTGPSSFIDATGRVLAITEAHDPVVEPGVQPEHLLGEVALMPPRRTVFAAVGNLFGYLNLALSVGLVGLSFLRRRRQRSPG